MLLTVIKRLITVLHSNSRIPNRITNHVYTCRSIYMNKSGKRQIESKKRDLKQFTIQVKEVNKMVHNKHLQIPSHEQNAETKQKMQEEINIGFHQSTRMLTIGVLNKNRR